MKKNALTKVLSMIVVLTLLLSILPVSVWAADHIHDETCGYSEPSDCTHAHDDSCGYAAAVEGASCGHSHDAACGYSEGSAGTPCGHVHGDCGYAEASPCTFTPCDHSSCGYIAGSPCNGSEGCDHLETDNCGYVEGVECPNAGQTCDHSTCGYTGGSPCNHTEHTDCGYSAPVEGVACNHSHDANCGYVEAVEEKPCTHEHNDTCGYSEGSPCTYVEPEHSCEWGDWISNGNGTHTHTCTTDASHTETADCSAYSYAMVDEQNHNILCKCLDGENLFVLGTESHTMSDWYSDGDGERRECTAGCDYFETRSIDTHTHDYTAVVTDPTCGERGYTTYTCSCNDSYVSDYVDALGHDWGDYVSIGNGRHTRVCRNDSSHEQTMNCGGRATCHEFAFCPDCKTTYGEYDQKNHSGGTEVRNAKDATETENGYTGDTYCLGCETLLNEGSIIYATGSGDDDDDTHTHNYSYYNYDGTNHWKMCHCGQGQAGSVKPHSLVTTGVSTGHLDECTVCNYNSAIQNFVFQKRCVRCCENVV